ncbi:MAG: hypothetical protein KDE20_19070 [Caldilineaceae bacterium]|nr:hypothetical protein [Caldilineaceae bacterium]
MQNRLYTQAVEMVNVSRVAVATKRRRKVDVRSERLELWRYAQQEMDAVKAASASVDSKICNSYLDGLLMGYHLAMNALKKARCPLAQMSQVLKRKNDDNTTRLKLGLRVDWDYMAGYEYALNDIMGRMEVNA